MIKLKKSQFHYLRRIGYQFNGVYEVRGFGIIHCLNGELHRLDGPAFESKYKKNNEFHIFGWCYRCEEHYWREAYLISNNLGEYK